jgi:hypothetical protein
VATHTISGQPWADGTTVSVYPAGALPAGYDGTPLGTMVESGTVANGSVTFDVQEDVPYVAYAGGVAKRFLVPRQRVDTIRERVVRLEESGAGEFHSIRDFGARLGATNNIAAFQRAAASGIRTIYVPEGYGDIDSSTAGFIFCTTPYQRWVGDGPGSLIRQAKFGARTFDTNGMPGMTFEGLRFEYRDTKVPGLTGTIFADYNGDPDPVRNEDAASMRSAFIFGYGSDDLTCRHLEFYNVFTGIRVRSQDRWTQQVWSPVLHDIRMQHMDFGVGVSNAIDMRVDGIHGRDTDLTSQNPPHLFYFAGNGRPPTDVLTAAEGTGTNQDTYSVGGVIQNCTDHDNIHADSYKLKNLKGTLVSNLLSKASARGIAIDFCEQVTIQGFKAHDIMLANEADSQQSALGVLDSARITVADHDIDIRTGEDTVRGVKIADSVTVQVKGGMVDFNIDPTDNASRFPYSVEGSKDVTLDEVGWRLRGNDRYGAQFAAGSTGASTGCKLLAPNIWKADPTWNKIIKMDTTSSGNLVVIDPDRVNFTVSATASVLDQGTGNVVRIGGGWLRGSVTWDPPALTAGTQTTTTVTVTGAVVGDLVVVSLSKDLLGAQLTGYVSVADTVTVVLRNGTGGTLDFSSGTLRASVRRGL